MLLDILSPYINLLSAIGRDSLTMHIKESDQNIKNMTTFTRWRQVCTY